MNAKWDAMPHMRQQNKSTDTERYKAKFGSTALQARLRFGGIFMILAVLFIIKSCIISIGNILQWKQLSCNIMGKLLK